MQYPKLAQFKDAAALRRRLAALNLELPLDDVLLTAAEGSPLARPARLGRYPVGNRWCIHPMEGWDGEADGSPSGTTLRRWQRFGASGAKLIWGGEAAAVRPDGRANPRQLLATPDHHSGLARLLDALREAHARDFGGTRALDDLVVGLQLTHSGRFARPHGPRLEPRLAFRHPLLDSKFDLEPVDDRLLWTDDELEQLIDCFVAGAQTAARAGFQFVDVKACHGYLLHELLGAHTRPGKYGGDLEGRTRMLRTIIERIRGEVPELLIGVRLSVFDVVPFATSREVGQPLPYHELLPYRLGFGVRADDPREIDLDEPVRLVQSLGAWGVSIVNVSAGSPYYSHHVQRPASVPPSDGYQPPEDPLVGVVRQIQATRTVKQAAGALAVVGTGYSYLQDFLPQVAQAVVRAGWTDWVGIGRMVLSYPRIVADSLEHGRLERKLICRTFSDCTTGPRLGLISGCYPLDPFYKQRPEAEALRVGKQQIKSVSGSAHPEPSEASGDEIA